MCIYICVYTYVYIHMYIRHTFKTGSIANIPRQWQQKSGDWTCPSLVKGPKSPRGEKGGALWGKFGAWSGPHPKTMTLTCTRFHGHYRTNWLKFLVSCKLTGRYPDFIWVLVYEWHNQTGGACLRYLELRRAWVVSSGFLVLDGLQWSSLPSFKLT